MTTTPQRLLLAASPMEGHLAPVLAVARALVDRDHHVTVLTSAPFEPRVRASGADFVALPAQADYDDGDLDAAFPERRGRRGLAKLTWDVKHVFVDPMPHQYRALRALVEDRAIDAVVAELGFLGVVPLATLPRAERPPILTLGVVPLVVSDRDVAPTGLGLAPLPGRLGRARNAVLRLLVQRLVMGSAQRYARRTLASTGAGTLPGFFMDWAAAGDRFLQLSAPEQEYPRSQLPSNVRFVGPVLPSGGDHPLPEWWGDLDGSRPVVHVTQGTIDNSDLDRVIGPTLRALSDTDVLVVVSTGGRPVDAVPAPLPANARVAPMLPYDRLLPKVDAMVTNGGYGGSQYALAHGIPLVVAGDGEDKPEVAARVAWSGAGVDLRTGDPSPDRIGAAVRAVLETPRYGERAQELARAIARLDSLNTIVAEIENQAAPRPAAVGLMAA